jgi:hypothetical protein
MADSTGAGGGATGSEEMSDAERSRVTAFIIIQVLFLLVSPLAGGFHYKMWSMLDSAILVISIGLSGLLFVLEGKASRARVFKLAVILYVLGVVDIAVNIMISGWIGWERAV